MCPNPGECVLCVKDGKVFCKVHERFLTIASWEGVDFSQTKPVTMHHVLYIAFSNGNDGEVLIDEEQ